VVSTRSSASALFEDIDVRTAAERLREALACPPCPEQDDQIEDLATHLFLVRSRSDHLADLAGRVRTPE
jgi:hypothetical protein